MDPTQESAFVALVRDAAALLNAAIRLHIKIRTPHPTEAELTELLDYFYRMKCEASRTRGVRQEARDAEKVLTLLRTESRRSPILDSFEYAQRLEEMIWGRLLPVLPPRITPVPAGLLEPPKRLHLPDGSSRLTRAAPCPAHDERMIPDDELNRALAKLTEATPTRLKLQADDVLRIPDFASMRDGMDTEFREAMRYLEMSPGDRSQFLAGLCNAGELQQGEYHELQSWATSELSGGQRRLVDELIAAGGTMTIADLQAATDIEDPNRTRNHVNRKLAKAGWLIERHDNEYRLVRSPR